MQFECRSRPNHNSWQVEGFGTVPGMRRTADCQNNSRKWQLEQDGRLLIQVSPLENRACPRRPAINKSPTCNQVRVRWLEWQPPGQRLFCQFYRENPLLQGSSPGFSSELTAASAERLN